MFKKRKEPDANKILSDMQQQVQSSLLAQEQLYNQIRQTGEEAPAKILNLMDTGVRLGDNASMLRFNMEVFPTGRSPFRAETQNSISDASRPKFMPGATVYVKFNPNDPTQVAIDHAPMEGPRQKVITCGSCGATQEVKDGQGACAYCGKPLPG